MSVWYEIGVHLFWEGKNPSMCVIREVEISVQA